MLRAHKPLLFMSSLAATVMVLVVLQGERMGSPAGGAVSELLDQQTVPPMTKNGHVDDDEDDVLEEISPRACSDLHNGNDSCWNGSADAPSSPAPPASSSASSGFSDDDSLHGADDGRGMDLEQFVQMVQSKGRTGLRLEYTEIRTKPPDGTFNHAK